MWRTTAVGLKNSKAGDGVACGRFGFLARPMTARGWRPTSNWRTTQHSFIGPPFRRSAFQIVWRCGTVFGRKLVMVVAFCLWISLIPCSACVLPPWTLAEYARRTFQPRDIVLCQALTMAGMARLAKRPALCPHARRLVLKMLLRRTLIPLPIHLFSEFTSSTMRPNAEFHWSACEPPGTSSFGPTAMAGSPSTNLA